MDHDEHSLLRENIPAYALGALDAEETAALETHLQTCDSCRAELTKYRAVGDSLLMATPPRQPSPALRKRLQSQLPSAQRTTRPRRMWSFGRLAMGVGFILLLMMNLFSLLQLRAIQMQQSSFLQQLNASQFALSMLAYPGTQAFPITGENLSGSVLLDRERNTAALVIWHLPELSEEQTYQAWLIEPDGHRVSAGVFRPQPDMSYTTQPIYAKDDVSGFIGIGVTIEPAGGSEQPTGPRIFIVEF
jgi:anti-sigma-K factor RskA